MGLLSAIAAVEQNKDRERERKEEGERALSLARSLALLSCQRMGEWAVSQLRVIYFIL